MSKKNKKDSPMKMVNFSLEDEGDTYLAADAENKEASSEEEEVMTMEEPEVEASKEEAPLAEDEDPAKEEAPKAKKNTMQTGVKLAHIRNEKSHKVQKYIPARVKH